MAFHIVRVVDAFRFFLDNDFPNVSRAVPTLVLSHPRSVQNLRLRLQRERRRTRKKKKEGRKEGRKEGKKEAVVGVNRVSYRYGNRHIEWIERGGAGGTQ